MKHFKKKKIERYYEVLLNVRDEGVVELRKITF